ncbi:MAG: ATP-binding cassette domain-containing protein, partial [Raoultibacter sp.]
LDIRAIAWLAEHLRRRWPQGEGALLVVTHDRWFLDEVAESMWEVHDGIVEPFEGGYSAYILQRVERERVAQVSEQKRKNLARKELAWLSRGARARATKPKFHMDLARELIADEPPARDPLELKRVAVARLGKQVIDLLNISESFGNKTILDDLTWLIGPGDRYGILGENGAGKTTLLRVLQGELPPTKGRVKIGKTVQIAVLSQRLDELEELADDRVREVLGRYKARYIVGGKSLTPAQLLERLGFERGHLQARVSDLSGGQKRRLQLMLTLLQEPNVLILDEPGNDMDTDMLAIMEDLLDSWPGTLILVSHDRYLMERVTDNQYALIDGSIRHMPGGVDEFLKILDERETPAQQTPEKQANSSQSEAAESPSNKPTLTGGEAFQARKQLAATERKIATLEDQADRIASEMHTLDPSDFVGLGDMQAKLQTVRDQINELEDQWMELSEQLGD